MITIIIPAYNEENAIAKTINEIKVVIDASYIEDSEILVVNDGSTDSTEKRAIEAGARVISHPHNVGYGRSLKDGITNALFDTIVIIDADLTYPAESIPILVEEYSKGFDLVVGARTGHHYEGSMFKGPLRNILKYLVEFTAGRKVPDANSGLRVFSRETISGYVKHLCDTFSFTTSQTLAYMMTGKFVKYLPIEYNERVGSTKVKLFKDSMRTLQYILQAIIYYNPMKIFLMFSVLIVASAILLFIVGAVTGLNAPYILSIGALMLSVLIFSLGLLADLLRQILVK